MRMGEDDDTRSAAIDRQVRAYSRGMRQRLAIAQAMLGMPDLLVLDEPMNGLDPPQIREMRDVLLAYAAAGRTVILSSHLLGEVEQTCTHVVVMHEGRRVAAGPVAEIIGEAGALMVGTPEPEHAVAVLRAMDGIEGAEAHPDGVLVRHDGVPPSAVVAALVGAGVPVDRVAWEELARQSRAEGPVAHRTSPTQHLSAPRRSIAPPGPRLAAIPPAQS